MVIELLDFLYWYVNRKCEGNNVALSFSRYVLRVTANAILPTLLYITRNNTKYRLTSTNPLQKESVIVSIATFSARINDVWKVVETVLRQSVKPDRIILWLDKSQLCDINSLPKLLREQVKRGLEIRFADDDIRSYKKFYYTMKLYPKSICITLDDDIYYHPRLIESLLAQHAKDSLAVCCTLARRCTCLNDYFLPYRYWKEIRTDMDTLPREDILPIGAGGILYPPKSLHQEVFNKWDFKKVCPVADDLWLWAMAHANRTLHCCCKNRYGYLPILIKGNVKLSEHNTIRCGNDTQLKRLETYCKSKINFSLIESVRETTQKK